MDYKEKLNELLLTTARQNASDLHLAVGRRPTLRIDGVLVSLQKENILTPEDTQGLILALLTPEQKDKMIKLRILHDMKAQPPLVRACLLYTIPALKLNRNQKSQSIS